jgi:hypothetical protein
MLSKSEDQIKVILPYEKFKVEIRTVCTDTSIVLCNLQDNSFFGILISPDDGSLYLRLNILKVHN